MEITMVDVFMSSTIWFK